jgi:hypothetical protein
VWGIFIIGKKTSLAQKKYPTPHYRRAFLVLAFLPAAAFF